MNPKNVLRYWLSLVRMEEALARRPRARRPNFRPGPVNLQEPVPGQDYAKLTYVGAEAFLTDQGGELLIPLDAEWGPFFESWLVRRYRGGADDDGALDHLVLFPSLHLPRDELAGVLRFPVGLAWLDQDGRCFVVPSRTQRRRRELPAPPTRARLSPGRNEVAGELPCFIDAKLLRTTLQVDEDRIDALVSGLRERIPVSPREMVWAVCRTLEAQCAAHGPPLPEPARLSAVAATPSEPGVVLGRLQAAVRLRLTQIESRARAYPVALVTSGTLARTTWHLQRDLAATLELSGFSAHSPLRAYLTGHTRTEGSRTLWGRWHPPKDCPDLHHETPLDGAPGLTDSQRVAGERTLGSELAAVQGPPGTGKTTLILSLLAHGLVTKVTPLALGKPMGEGITVVASTNNRAVDNVVSPLGHELGSERLALSLRVGSRQVIEQTTAADLRRVTRWLAGRELAPDEARRALDGALDRFRALQAELSLHLAPEQAYHEALDRGRAIERQLRELEAAPAGKPSALFAALAELWQAGRPVGKDDSNQARDEACARFLDDPARHPRTAAALIAVSTRLEALSRLAEGSTQATLEAVRRHWKRTRKKTMRPAEEALGFPFGGSLPPAEPAGSRAALESWEDAAETLSARIREVVLGLEQAGAERSREARAVTLRRELAAHRAGMPSLPAPIGPSAREGLERLHAELFRAAVAVREAWALFERTALLGALEHATEVAAGTRSLRGLMEVREGPGVWLRRLFPAWGCTLLSLGNVFPPAQGLFELTVIDEAGQCHPAYAIAALLRASSALVIGDVQQLEPVLELSPADEARLVRGMGDDLDPAALGPYRVHEGSGTSAQSLADRAVSQRPTLTDHFRCQRAIVEISDAICGYGLVVHTQPRTRVEQVPWLTAPVLHAAVAGQQDRHAGSWMNEAEAQATITLVQHLLESGIAPAEIALVTPFRGQLERLWRLLRASGVPLERPPGEGTESEGLLDAQSPQGLAPQGLALGTVHRFQGGERSIVLFTSTVTQARSLPFLNDRPNLVNVAVSRAREHLVTIGHTPTLVQGRFTRHLVERAQPLGA